MFSIIDTEAMEREEAELKAALAAQEAEKKAAAATIPGSRVMPPAPPSSRWDGTDTLRTPTTDTVASEPAPKESKSLQSWFFTEEVETDRFAEPEPPPPPKSESFFSGWTIFETLFSSRTNTEDDTTTTTGFFSGPIPRRTGWLFIDMFMSEKTDTVARKPGFSFLTKFLMLAVPLIAFAGYYQYAQVSGATILGKTLSNSVNLERGLVGHWTFDGGDMTANTATDVSGNGNNMFYNASIDGAASPSIGRIGQGVQYPGVGGCSHYRVNTIDTTMVPKTIAVWIKPRRVSSSQIIMARGTGSSNSANGWFVRLVGGTPAASLEFEVGFNTTDLTKESEPNIIESNEWQHVVTTWDGSNLASNVKIYKNGLEVSSYDVVQNGSSVDDEDWTDIWLGRSSGGSSCFDGTLDDVRIYNRVLSAKEIERLYKMGEGVKINTNTIPTGSTLEDGLVGYWSFNGQDFTDKVYDRSGQNNHGSLGNIATASAKVAGKVGQGLKLNNSTAYLNVGSAASLDNITQKTITMWILPTSGTLGELVSKGNALEYQIDFTDNKLRFRHLFFTPGHWETPTNSIELNKWNFITVTYDRSSTANDPTFYINGQLVTTIETQAPASVVGDDSASNLYIGNYVIPISAYTGTLDEVRIYNRVLSADEVAQLYRSGSGVTIKNCREESVQDADGNWYNTLAIGSQCWLDRNMDVGTRVSGATTQTNNSTIEKYCYSNTDSNCTANNPNKPDGGLYQWNEAMQYSTTEGARGICPAGFHIPTDAEWHTLEKFLTDSGQSCNPDRSSTYDCSPAGTKLKPNGSSGFEANLAGSAVSGSFSFRGAYGGWWSSSPSGGNAWYRLVVSGEARVARGASTQTYGLSVRCLQD